jgi:hypothetical protein
MLELIEVDCYDDVRIVLWCAWSGGIRTYGGLP